MTLEQQLDALIAEHHLSSITITRLAGMKGNFWGINAQGGGMIGSDVDSRGGRAPSAHEGLTRAITDLNTQRTAPVVVPDLEIAA